MAEGDQKIDLFDQTYLKNRLTDGEVDIMLDGRPTVWAPGQIRPIVSAYAPHFLKHSTFSWDPTETDLPKRKLFECDADGTPRTKEDSFPLTLEEATPLDLINDAHLPVRYTDTETGQPLTRKEGRFTNINPKREGLGKRDHKSEPRPGWNADQAAALTDAADAAAIAER